MTSLLSAGTAQRERGGQLDLAAAGEDRVERLRSLDQRREPLLGFGILQYRCGLHGESSAPRSKFTMPGVRFYSASRHRQAALIFIGLVAANLSEQRVSIRASQGGHDVPTDKLVARYPRSIANLERAIERLPLVLVYDNSDLRSPYTPVAQFDHGSEVWRAKNLPRWFPKKSRPR